MVSGFTDDILIEIFTYLPLNSINKFKCLSKVWLSNLSNPNFITKWFQIHRKSLPWIQYRSMSRDPSNETPLRFSYLYPDSHSEFMSRNEHLYSFKFLINEIPFQVARLYLFGSSNGLVLVESFDLGVWESFQVSCDENVKWVWYNYDKVVILNGVLFWIEGDERMLVYNLNQKNQSDGHQCRLINLPDEYSDFDSILVESEGCVCCSSTTFTDGEVTLNVWVLDEVNWRILHKDILLDDILDEVHSQICYRFETVQVVGLSPVDRNVVLLGSEDWVCGFNIQTRRVEELCLDNKDGYGDGTKFLPFVLKPMPTVLPPPSWIDT